MTRAPQTCGQEELTNSWRETFKPPAAIHGSRSVVTTCAKVASLAQGASNAQVDAMCRNLKLGTVLGKTQACPITTVAWFFGVKRAPQTAARVEQISEWISIWRNCNVDTRRRIHRFWRKKASMLAVNLCRWSQATGPISATICSVLEAVWKPSSPPFWQSPDGSATLDGALF